MPIAILSVLGVVAGALTPVLVADAPLLLLALESRNRYLLLVASRVDVAPYLVVGVLRRLASDPFFYLAGRWYGPRGVRWAERQVGGARWLPTFQRHFGRVGGLLVFAFPGALVCTLAGATGMSPRRFAVLNVAGTVAAVVALRAAADVLAGPLTAVVAFNDRYTWQLTAAFVALTGVWLVAQRRRTRAASVEGAVEELAAGDDEASPTAR